MAQQAVAARMTPQQIHQLTTANFGNAEVPQGRPTAGTGFNYGSGARSTSQPQPTRRNRSPRMRSRDRGKRGADIDQAESRYRTQPAGPHELEDWSQALEAANDRLDSLRRYPALHAQPIAHLSDDHSMMVGKVESIISPIH